MQDTMEVVTAEDTTPTPLPTAGEGEIPSPQPVASEEPPADTTPPTVDDSAEAVPPTVPVKFRHQSRELSIEEATGYAQMGLKYESLQPTLDKIRMMAAGRGQGLEEFVNAWAAAEERAALDRLIEKTGGDRDVAGQLWELEASRRQKVCEDRRQQAQKEEEQRIQDLNSRLAAEYQELTKECPEITTVDDLPEGVWQDAADNGRHLLDAYLRHQRRETRRIEQNERNRQAAEAAALGALADAPGGDGHDAATAAMLRAVRSVFS